MRKTSAMVEAGILAAIAVVMALISNYVPVIGAFVNFVWPLPVIICGMRNGFKYSFMTLVVASVIIAIVISPIQAFFLAVIFGLLGLVLGECLRRRLSPTKVMLYGSIAAAAALVLNIVLSFAILDIDPIAMMFSQFDTSLEEVGNFYRNHGVDEETTKAAVANYAQMVQMMRIIMPAAFLLSAPMFTFVNYFVAKKILTRLGESFESLPPFVQWCVPSWIFVPFALSLGGVTYFYVNQMTETWMYKACVNVQTVCTFTLVMQAVILIYWYVDNKHKPRWWAGVLTCLIFVIPILSQIMVYVGAFDMVIDFRKIRHDRGLLRKKDK